MTSIIRTCTSCYQASDICCSPPGAAVPGCQPAWFAGVRVTEKDTVHTATGWNNTSLTERRDGAKISLSNEYRSPMASTSYPTANAGRWSTHTSPVLQVNDLLLSPPGSDIAGVSQVPYHAHTLSRTKNYISNPEQGKIFPNDSTCPMICSHARVNRLYITVFPNSPAPNPCSTTEIADKTHQIW